MLDKHDLQIVWFPHLCSFVGGYSWLYYLHFSWGKQLAPREIIGENIGKYRAGTTFRHFVGAKSDLWPRLPPSAVEPVLIGNQGTTQLWWCGFRRGLVNGWSVSKQPPKWLILLWSDTILRLFYLVLLWKNCLMLFVMFLCMRRNRWRTYPAKQMRLKTGSLVQEEHWTSASWILFFCTWNI